MSAQRLARRRGLLPELDTYLALFRLRGVVIVLVRSIFPKRRAGGPERRKNRGKRSGCRLALESQLGHRI